MIDKNYTEFVKRYKLGGLLWGKVKDEGQGLVFSGPLSKVEPEILNTIPNVEAGDLILVGAGPANHVNTASVDFVHMLPRKEKSFPKAMHFAG